MTSLATWTLPLLLALSAANFGCTSVGPHPLVATISGEIEANPTVDKILIAPTTGTGSALDSDEINRAVPAAAFERYTDDVILPKSLDKVLVSLHQPKVRPVLLANWQAAFYQWVKDGVKTPDGEDTKPLKITRARSEMTLSLIEVAKVQPAGDKELKEFAKTLKPHLTAYKVVAKAVTSGNADDLADAVGVYKDDLLPSEQLMRYVLRGLSITYVLVSHVEGSAEAFAKNQQITLHAALVNAQTGQFRYYAKSTGRKAEVQTTYQGLIAMMARNMFEDLAKTDKIEVDD